MKYNTKRDEFLNDPEVKSIEDRLLNEYDNVYRVGIGPALVDGDRSGEFAIHAYVDEKTDDLPQEQKVPRYIDGYRIDIIESDRSQITNDLDIRSRRVRPLLGGLRISSDDTGGGTGSIAQLTDGTPVMLTNEHIIDTGSGYADEMFQPNEADPDRKIGPVLDWDTTKDAATIEIEDPAHANSATLGGGVVEGVLDQPSFDHRVIVFTGFHQIIGGDLISIFNNPDIRQNYSYSVDEDFDTAGSSGSLSGHIIDGDMYVFGQHNSASSTQNIRYAADIQDIMDNLNVEFPDDPPDYDLDISPNIDEKFEGTAVGGDAVTGELYVQVLNSGSEPGTTTVELIDNQTSSVHDSQSVTLDEARHTTITMDCPDHGDIMLDFGDVQWNMQVADYVSGEQLVTGEVELDGVGVDGATVKIWDLSENVLVEELSTDANGEFETQIEDEYDQIYITAEYEHA